MRLVLALAAVLVAVVMPPVLAASPTPDQLLKASGMQTKFLTCGFYFRLTSQYVDNTETKLSERLVWMSNTMNAGASLLITPLGQSNTGYKGRATLIDEQMMDKIDNNCQNMSVLIIELDKQCKTLLNDVLKD